MVEASGEGVDLVQSSVTWTLATNVEHLTLTDALKINGTGNTSANVLTGNAGSNALSGLEGADTLIGGAGNDTLTGGTGADAFVFNSLSSGLDTIVDFNAVGGASEQGDVLRFDGLLVGTFSYLGADAFSAGGETEARVSGNQVQVDINGDATADITIALSGLLDATQLDQADFLFV